MWLSLIFCLAPLLSRAHPNICKLYFFNIISSNQGSDCFNSTVLKQWAKFNHSTEASKAYPIYSGVTEPFLTHTREIKANLTHAQTVKCIETFSFFPASSSSHWWKTGQCKSMLGSTKLHLTTGSALGDMRRDHDWAAAKRELVTLLNYCRNGAKHQKSFHLHNQNVMKWFTVLLKVGGWIALEIHWSIIQIWKNMRSFSLKTWI